MIWNRPTYRLVDGERIDGVWCHVWIKHYEDHLVDDLFVYADSAIRCSESMDLQGLQRRLASGEIALRDPARPAPAWDTQTPRWSARYPEPVTDEGFLREIQDAIEELNGRPTSSQRCHEAIERYKQEPTEDNRQLLRGAYLEIPAHERVYVLGDMDRQDIPLRILITDLGEPVGGDGPIATAELHREVLEYFEAGDRGVAHSRELYAILYADDPATAGHPAVTLRERGNPPTEPPDRLDLFALRNECPAPFTYRDQRYPTVIHAYWALASADPADHERIREAVTTREAHEAGGRATLRPEWPIVRTAVMAGLLRAKFTQHPAFAEVLLSTGDARISYTGISESPHWTDRGPREGRNWMGRLLELTRAELAADANEH